MKKVFVVMIALCMLFLWGCEGINPGGTTAPTQPVVMEDPARREAAGLVLHISFNPEFKLTLSQINSILSVNPLNEAAEELFAELDVVGMGYEIAIEKILETAEQKDLLKNGAVVRIVATEETYGAWSVISETIITKPVEDYRQNASVSFTLDLTPAGRGVDLSGLQKNVDKTDEYYMVYYTDYTGRTIMTTVTNSNGTYVECHYPTIFEMIYYTRYANGDVDYFHQYKQVSTGYSLGADGRLWEYLEYYDSQDNLICSLSVDATGWTSESTYENQQKLCTVDRWPDGTMAKTTYRYHPNGTEAGYKTVYEDGDYQEVSYDEEGRQTGHISHIDGVYTEVTMDADGNYVSIYSREENGRESISTLEKGIIVREETTWPNGDYMISTWNEAGLQQTITAQIEGQFREEIYDQDGLLYSTRETEPDGTTRLWIYENGFSVSCTITNPDGTTYTEYCDHD